MTLEIHFLHFNPSFFPPNLVAMIVEHGEDITKITRHYEDGEQLSSHMEPRYDKRFLLDIHV